MYFSRRFTLYLLVEEAWLGSGGHVNSKGRLQGFDTFIGSKTSPEHQADLEVSEWLTFIMALKKHWKSR